MKLIPRETPLKLKRVMSVFRERIEKHKDELQELEELEKLVEKEKPVRFFYLRRQVFICCCFILLDLNFGAALHIKVINIQAKK